MDEVIRTDTKAVTYVAVKGDSLPDLLRAVADYIERSPLHPMRFWDIVINTHDNDDGDYFARLYVRED